jgi:peptidoglycan/xylan/chitin deacetylase (PgdA/CDA1 family)
MTEKTINSSQAKTSAQASSSRKRQPKNASGPSSRPVAQAKRKRLGAPIGVLLALLTVGCVAFGLVAFAPANALDQRPRLIAALFTATPTASATPTATDTASPTPTGTPTASYTPTLTLTPSVTPTETPTGTPTPQPTPDGRDREFYIPILMYHYISEPPPDADVYRLDLSVNPDNFREQMAWLKSNGYQTISLYDLVYALNIGWPPLPDRPIIITFDDGYVDNYQNAFPILQEFGFTATFFILTDVTDRNDPNYMSWDMLREMSQAGMSIEVHGREHLDMTGRDHDWLIFHLLGPAQTIEANLGYQPRFLSYPAGNYDELVISTAHEVGYWGAVTTRYGMLQTKEHPFEFQRLRIRGDWGLDVFTAIVTGSG